MYKPRRSLITGASSGIGADFARALAERGSDLVLVARREDRLRELGRQLMESTGVRVEVLAADLAEPRVGARLREQIEGPIDTVINAAGFGTHGNTVLTEPDLLAKEVDVDVRAVVEVTRAFLPELIAARHGAIVNIASTASFQPIPGMAVYAASKAFVRSFSEAVWHEARPYGVKVTALCPGATRTEFFDVIGTEAAAVGAMQTVEEVSRAGLRALDRRKTPASVVSGRRNAFTAWTTRLLPRESVIGIAARLASE